MLNFDQLIDNRPPEPFRIEDAPAPEPTAAEAARAADRDAYRAFVKFRAACHFRKTAYDRYKTTGRPDHALTLLRANAVREAAKAALYEAAGEASRLNAIAAGDA